MAFNPVKEDVAKDGMINVEDATTHIKELVIKSLNAGESKEQILSDVKRIIAKCIKGIEAIHDKETVMKSLWSLANQVLYEYTRAVQVFTLNAYNKAVDLGFMNDTYSYSFGDSKKVIDNFRNMIDSEKKAMIFPIIEDYQKKLRDTIRVLSAESPIAVEKTPTGATRKLGLRARAELQIRYEANMQELERYKTEGAKLVWITSHPNCSPRCAKYQGRLYSLDGTTGKIDGHSYEPIEVALAGPYGDGNGCISGYNCRHRLIEYKSGSKPPIEYTEAEIKRAYGIDREQRAYENEIRQMKVEERLLRAHGDTEAAKILRKKWRILTKKYEIFCLENKRPMTTWRCVVSKEEMEDILKNNANVVDKPKNEDYNVNDVILRRPLSDRNDIPPISKEQLEKAKKEIEKAKGSLVFATGGDELELLNKQDASAITLGDIIIIRENATASEVYEELYHLWQNNNPNLVASTDKLTIIEREIEAAEYLIKNKDELGICEKEHQQNIELLESYKKRLEKIKKE